MVVRSTFLARMEQSRAYGAELSVKHPSEPVPPSDGSYDEIDSEPCPNNHGRTYFCGRKHEGEEKGKQNCDCSTDLPINIGDYTPPPRPPIDNFRLFPKR